MGLEETPSAGVIRVAREQIEIVLATLRDRRHPLEERVHEARRCGKKLRALMRLLRSQDEEFFSAENAAIRDAARELSTLRDWDVILAACGELAEHSRDPHLHCFWERLQRRLAMEQRAEGMDAQMVERKLRQFVQRFLDIEARALFWPVGDAPPPISTWDSSPRIVTRAARCAACKQRRPRRTITSGVSGLRTTDINCVSCETGGRKRPQSVCARLSAWANCWD